MPRRSSDAPPRAPSRSADGAKTRRRRLRVFLFVLGALLAPPALLGAASFVVPLPETLRTREASVRVLDRDDRLLVEVSKHGERRQPIEASSVPSALTFALLAAEDARFFAHPGLDPLAILRAAFDAVRAGRIVSGASTLTQQLARAHFERPRNLLGKLREAALALRIEREFSKTEILLAYLNDVSFAPNTRGIAAVSRALLDKNPESLDVAEAALLVGLARGPSLYDPRRRTELATRRRDRVLARMLERGFVTPEAFERARRTPVVLHQRYQSGRAQHFSRALVSGALRSPENVHLGELRTTLDAALQTELERLVEEVLLGLEAVDASAAAIVVLDNGTGDVLGYVGSGDFWSERTLGQNDGVLARRQPGSTLKPLLYAAAMEELGDTPATLLPDIELKTEALGGEYAPKNYDGKFHGPVRLRHALANSLNVPAVATILRLGPARFLERLHALGFASLREEPSHYGAALALGDGEVTLLELTNAYRVLARGGTTTPVRTLRVGEPEEPVRLLRPETAALVSSMLSDDAARESAFGRNNVLDLDFPVAAKTGTSKGYRDNFTVGYSSAVTIGVWVGNFDGHPMRGISGVTGAGPLFRKAMLAAMRAREALPLVDGHGLRETEICPLSGARPGPHCPHGIRELFEPNRVPRETCAMHTEVMVTASGLRAGAACRKPVTRHRVEVYPDEYASWAKSAGRPLPPSNWDPECPGVEAGEAGRVRILFPRSGATFSLDPSLPREKQRIVVRLRGAGPFVLEHDGRPATVTEHSLSVALEPGEHRLVARAKDGVEHAVVYFVR